MRRFRVCKNIEMVNYYTIITIIIIWVRAWYLRTIFVWCVYILYQVVVVGGRMDGRHGLVSAA